MTNDDIFNALRSMLPADWEVCEAPCSRHFEVWGIPDDEWGEWVVAISHSENWQKARHAVKGKWHAVLTDNEDEQETQIWCETPEEAVAFVKRGLPELRAAVKRYKESDAEEVGDKRLALYHED